MIACLLAAAFGIGIVVLMRSGGRGSLSGFLGPAAGIAIIAAFVVLVLALRARRGSATKRDASPVESTATRLGLAYEKRADDFHRQFGPLPGIPGNGKVRHVLSGTLGEHPLTVFQHTYVVNTGQGVFPVHHTAYVTDAPPWPSLTVSRRNVFGRLLLRVGVRRGLLLEDHVFNAAMRIRTDDEDFTLTLLHPEMQAFLAEKPSVTWRVHPGRCAMIYGGALRSDRIERSLERFGRFWTLVPPELMAW